MGLLCGEVGLPLAACRIGLILQCGAAQVPTLHTALLLEQRGHGLGYDLVSSAFVERILGGGEDASEVGQELAGEG